MKKYVILCVVTMLLLLLLLSVLGCQSEVETAARHTERGIALTNEGHYEQAISEFDKAIMLDPEYVNAYHYLGVTYLKQGKLDKAITNFSKAIDLDPDSALDYYNRGYSYCLKGDMVKAIIDSVESIELSDDPELVAAAYQLLDDLYVGLKFICQ